MRPSVKIATIRKIARELDNRDYSLSEVDSFLGEFGIPTLLNHSNFYDSFSQSHDAVAYAQQALQEINVTILARVAEELDIDLPANPIVQQPPEIWPDNKTFRLFISHIAKDKDKATRLRGCLIPYHISGFVAHEDISPTKEWMVEIERALFAMDAFLAIHTKGFSASVWAQQEVGFAVARGVKIISFKMGEDPTGFISKHQALPRLDRQAEHIAKEVNDLLLGDHRTSTRLQEIVEADGEIPF